MWIANWLSGKILLVKLAELRDRCVRPMLTLMAYLGRGVFLIVTIVIFAIALLAFLRLRNRKTALLTIGFGLFLAHGILAVPELFFPSYNSEFTTGYHLLLDSAALLFILIGALKD